MVRPIGKYKHLLYLQKNGALLAEVTSPLKLRKDDVIYYRGSICRVIELIAEQKADSKGFMVAVSVERIGEAIQVE
jgi:hypothetical protein